MNTTYKIIKKILAQLIKPIVSTIISPYQITFQKKLIDNIILAKEILHTFKTRDSKKYWCFLKSTSTRLMIELNGNSYKMYLQPHGFAEPTVWLIMSCVTIASHELLINKNPMIHLNTSRGIRQGCPLSPYLFILATNMLSKQIEQPTHNGLLAPFPLPGYSTHFNHPLFVDDTLIFVKGTSQDFT